MHAGRPIANIPEIHFVRGYVRVPAQQNLIIAIVVLIKVLSQSVYPIKLELKFFAADLCSMRKISVDDSNAVNVCRDQPVGCIGWVGWEAFLDRGQRFSRKYRDAVIGSLAMYFDVCKAFFLKF